MKHDTFIAFILTHGRPDNVLTFRSLRKHGYTGRIVLLVDNEDKRRADYVKEFGEQVYVFDKLAVSETFDEGDNFNDRRAVIYARNACWEVAAKLGAKHFIQLDDDYTDFRFKIRPDDTYQNIQLIRNLDGVFDLLVDFLERTQADSVAMTQGGDWFGGGERFDGEWPLLRKAMNSFVCATARPFQFFGRINEDVNVYTCGARRGMLFFTLTQVALQQKATQTNGGGMTDFYLDAGTYVKSFYSVMYAPSCVTVAAMGLNKRLHHSVAWKHTAPLIVSERLMKS